MPTRTVVSAPFSGLLFVLTLACTGGEPGLSEEGMAALEAARLLPGPDFELLGLDGELHRLSDYRGQVVLVNFWATWCVSCRREMPDLQRLHTELAGESVAILGISTDREAAGVRPFVEELGIGYPILLDPGEITPSIFGGLEGYPKTYVLDREGQLYSSYLGAQERAILEEDLLYLLDAAPSPPASQQDLRRARTDSENAA